MARLIGNLRSGAWLTVERVRLVAFVVLAAGLIGAAFVAATSDGLNDRFGRPLGSDFSNVYAAGTYVLEGEPAAPFDPARQHAREQAIFGPATPFYGWHYPPFFLAIAAPLALMPYALALALWQGGTLVLYLFSVRGILRACTPSPRAWGEGWGEAASLGSRTSGKAPSPDRHSASKTRVNALKAGDLSPPAGRGEESNLAREPLVLLLALAFPAVFVNLGHGHNGFLTAALFAGALIQLDRRPWLAGILFGSLAYKPQFGVLIPLVLAASGHWRAFVAAAATVIALGLAVTVAFGTEVWTAFLASTGFTRVAVLEQGGTGWHKIQSVFSLVRLWGGGVPLAYAAQGAVSVAVASALVWLWRRRAAYPLQAAALLIGTILATPYSLDYDLMLLAPAIAFLMAYGIAHGFAAYEKSLLAGLWIVPLVARSVAEAALIPLAVPLMLIAFLVLLRRAMAAPAAARTGGILQSAP